MMGDPVHHLFLNVQRHSASVKVELKWHQMHSDIWLSLVLTKWFTHSLWYKPHPMGDINPRGVTSGDHLNHQCPFSTSDTISIVTLMFDLTNSLTTELLTHSTLIAIVKSCLPFMNWTVQYFALKYHNQTSLPL